jgi:hypothetical protein
MTWRLITPVLVACSIASTPAAVGQEALRDPSTVVVASPSPSTEKFDEILIPITTLSLGLDIEIKFATGFCLDAKCRFVGTNYHVAKFARVHAIEGEKVVHQYLATGADDEGATMNDPAVVKGRLVPLRSMKYTQKNDLAVFELRHPLRHRHGIAFNLGELEQGQAVDIYAYPKDSINPIRKLLQFHGTFKGQTTRGLLAFDYIRSGSKSIRPGASGGIVVDGKSQRIVGILCGTKNDEEIAVAVPVESLAEFVAKFEPYMAQSLFPSSQGISEVSADIYPKYVPTPGNSLEHRTEEPPGVRMLRSKAQALTDNIRDFIAVETFVWGVADKEPSADAAYEVRVADGYQQFRAYPDGKKELSDVPLPNLNNLIRPGGEWAELPEMVGTRLGLKIRQVPDFVDKGRRMKIFQYWADIEDDICKWRDIADFVLFQLNKDFSVACYGEVWTDEDTNILRMSEHYELVGRWKEYSGVVTYGSRQQGGQQRLVPLTISTQAKYHKKIYWCRGQFMNYQVFTAQVRIIAD